MKVYNYDKDSKEFLFVSDAQKHPKRSGEFIFPKNSTTIMPPETEENQAAVFNGVYWDIVPDYRGLEQIDLKTKEISVVNSTGELPEGFMLYSEYIHTDDYQKYLAEQKKKDEISEILFRLKTLDEKRVRAICEPEVKDESSGDTWLEYYNSQIFVLRKRLAEVNYDASC